MYNTTKRDEHNICSIRQKQMGIVRNMGLKQNWNKCTSAILFYIKNYLFVTFHSYQVINNNLPAFNNGHRI